MRKWNSKFRELIAYHASGIPTQEEVLDINFWAIVSDCRGILSGNLTPRSWADIATTWTEEKVINHGRYKISPPGPIGENKRPTTKRLNAQLAYRIFRLKKILMANGMDQYDAELTAAKLLTKETVNESIQQSQ